MSIPDQVQAQYLTAKAVAEQEWTDAVRRVWTLTGRARWNALRQAEERLATNLALARERHLRAES